MKKLLSKNIVIGVIAVSSLVAGANIVFDKSEIKFGPSTKKKNQAKRRGHLAPANPFKEDNELQVCYENLLRRQPEIQEGTVHFHMTINRSGEIDYLKMIHSDLQDPDFTDCVAEKIREKKLPATPDRIGTIISHKFNFHKRDMGELDFTN